MYKLKKTIKHLGLDDLILVLTGIVATAISLLDLVGWLDFSTDTLIQVAVAGLGLFMTAFVLQSSKQKKDRLELSREIARSLAGKSETVSFESNNDLFRHMAKALYSADSYVDHVSLGTVPRWPTAISEFEKAYRQIIRDDRIKVRYVADLTEESRRSRVKKLLSDPPEINQYFVRSVSPDQLAIPPINFMIIDGKEIILAIPAGFGDRDSLITIQNTAITQALGQYFNLIWSKSEAHPDV